MTQLAGRMPNLTGGVQAGNMPNLGNVPSYLMGGAAPVADAGNPTMGVASAAGAAPVAGQVQTPSSSMQGNVGTSSQGSYGYNLGANMNQAQGTSSNQSQGTSFGQNQAQGTSFGQNQAQNTAFGQQQAQNTAFGQNQAQNTAFGQNQSQYGTQITPGMLGVYNQLLGLNQSNYQNVLGAYTGGQSNLSQNLPGVYQGFGGVNSQVANTLGFGGTPWGIAAPAAQQIGQQFQQTQANTQQQMANAGLGNTTIGAGLENQNALYSGQALAGLGSQLAGTYAGYESQIGQAGLAARMQGLGMQSGLAQAQGGALAGYGGFSNTAGALTGGFGTSTGFNQAQGTSSGMNTAQGTSSGMNTAQGTSSGMQQAQNTASGFNQAQNTASGQAQNTSFGQGFNQGQNWSWGNSANVGGQASQGGGSFPVSGPAGAAGPAGGAGAPGGGGGFRFPGTGGTAQSGPPAVPPFTYPPQPGGPTNSGNVNISGGPTNYAPNLQGGGVGGGQLPPGGGGVPPGGGGGGGGGGPPVDLNGQPLPPSGQIGQGPNTGGFPSGSFPSAPPPQAAPAPAPVAGGGPGYNNLLGATQGPVVNIGSYANPQYVYQNSGLPYNQAPTNGAGGITNGYNNPVPTGPAPTPMPAQNTLAYMQPWQYPNGSPWYNPVGGFGSPGGGAQLHYNVRPA